MSQQVFFVDASVAGSDELKSALELSVGEGSKVFVLENNSDAFQQMDAALASLGDVQVDAVHIYAHGAAGSVTLGGKVVDQAALDESAAILDKIGSYLTEDADILLYSCNTAQGAAGQSFAQRLAALTRADVAASMDVTGSAGNWTLEYATGSVETASRDLPGYGGSLANKGTIVDDTVSWGTVRIDSETVNGQKLGGSVTSDKLYDRVATADGEADTLSGHDGDDIYYITNSKTRAYEDPNEGDDTLVSRVADYDLSQSDFEDVKTAIEHITLEAQEGFEDQSFTGSAVAQTITGNALNNKLVGMDGADSLEGGDGDDSLDGGNGALGANTGDDATAADTMVGGKGNDLYIVRNANQVVVEKAREGTDEVYSFINYTLGANVENLTLLKDAVSGTGNADANVLKGNSKSNKLEGLAGNDTLHGGKTTLGAGAVTYVNAFDVDVPNKAAVDVVEADRDIDTLDGGAGNDTYYVYREVLRDKATNAIAQGDVIVDAAGKDTIISTVNYNLQDAAQVEELQLVGSAKKGTGNSLNNRIVGNETEGSTLDGTAGSNTLVGGYGDDLFIMRSTGDKIEDLGGDKDTVRSYVTVNLASSKAAIENIELQDVDDAVLAKNKNANNINATAGKSVATKLVGNAGNNQLTGGDMNDTLYGGESGKDTLTGGKGNDLYVVTSADVTVKEAANAGEADSVLASVDYALGAKSNVEKLYLAKGAATGTGNEMANVIAVVGDATEGIKTATMDTLNTALGTIGLDTIDGATTKVVLDGGKNTAGLAGDTLVGAAAGNTQFYTYNANDSIKATGTGNVIYISYDVTASVNGKDAAAAETADWLAYFNARGVDLSAAGVTFVYRGNPEGKVTEAGRTIEGTTTSTYLVGTNRKDVITAHNSTATTIDGGTGADTMTGSTADDTFYVDDVKDVVAGKGGTDTVHSTVSVDLGARQTAFIKDGGDALMKAANNGIKNETAARIDVVLEGSKAISAAGIDTVANNLTGNSAANTLIGGNAGNTLDGGAGADVMVGGDGTDLFYIDNKGDKVVNGGTGDVIHTSGVAVDLTSANHGAGAVTKVAIEEAASVTGFYKAATKTDAAVTHAESITGSDGNDTIDGKGGADTVIAGDGNDLVYYHGTEAKVLGGTASVKAGSDTLVVASDVTGGTTLGYVDNGGNGSAEQLLGSFDAVTLAKGAKVNVNFTGATTAVTITGNEQDTSLTGGTGNDYIATGGGKDTVNAGAGDDTIELVTSASKTAYSAGEVNGGDGEDTLILGSGADKVVLSDGATTGVIVINTATAIKDVDTKVTAASIEEFNGGAGNDVIDATATRNGVTLSGGAGANTLYGGAGSDTFVLRDGTDTIYTDGNPKGEGYDNSIVAHDVIRLTADAVGKTFTVKDFNAGLDAVDCDALTTLGWDTVPASTQSGSTATLVWTSPTNSKEKITVKFENTTAADIKFESTVTVNEHASFIDANAKVKVVLAADSKKVAGSKYGDSLTVMDSVTDATAYGNAGDDTLTGPGTLYGGSGNDSLVGNGTLYGDGKDVTALDTTNGNATVTDAAAGNDTLVGTAIDGDTKYYTGGGKNVVRIEGLADTATGAATIDGTGGQNILQLGSKAELNLATPGVTMGGSVALDFSGSLATFASDDGSAGVEGSADNDTITAADSTALYYTTNGGADSVTGGTGDDTVVVTTLVDGTSIDLKAGTNKIVIEDVTPGPAEGGAVTLNADGGTLSLKFANAVKLDLDDATIEMGGDKLGGVTIEASTLDINGSEGADAITAKHDTALSYETHGGADTVIGSNAADTIMVNTLLNGVSINGNGGADLISVGKLDTKGTATISGGADGTATLSFSEVGDTGEKLTLNIKGNNSSVVLGPDKNTATATVNLKGMDGVTTFEGSDNVDKNYFYVDSLTAGMALIGAGAENVFHVADFANDAAVTITGGAGNHEALAFRTAASGQSIDLDFSANTVSLGTRGTNGNLQDGKTMSLANVTNIDNYIGTDAADKVTGKANTELHYSTHEGADTVTAQGTADDKINISYLVKGMKINVANATNADEITIENVKTFTGDTEAAKRTEIKSEDGKARLVFDGDETGTGVKVDGLGEEKVDIRMGGYKADNVYLTGITSFVGTEHADTLIVGSMVDNLTIDLNGADDGQDEVNISEFTTNATGVVFSGTDAKLSFTEADRESGEQAPVTLTLTADGIGSTIQIGEKTANAKITGFTTFEGHTGVDTFSIASLADGMVLDGASGGADVFEIKALADDDISATVNSGAAGGTLSFASAAADVVLTLGTANSATVGSNTATLELTNISNFTGATAHANTFNVGTLANVAYTLTGGSQTDTVSFADKTGDAGVTAGLTDSTLTVTGGPTLTLSSIEKIEGTAKADVFTVDSLADGMVLDGGEGGADVFNVTALAANNIAATVKSGAAGGTLSFDSATADVVLTLGTANSAKVGENATQTLTLTNISTFAGSGTKDNTFKVGTLSNAEYTLTGGNGADTLSYEDAAAAVTVTLTDDKATVGTAELTLSGIETIKGHSGDDTFKVAGMESGSYTLAGNGGSDTVSFEDAEAGVTASLADTTLTFGSASVTLDGVTTIKGSTKADTFTVDSLADGWTLDGGTGGADVFNVTALAANNIAATVKSGAAGGTLSFDSATADVVLTLGTANSAKVGENATQTLTLTNISTFAGSGTKDNTFKVGTLEDGTAYALTGGSGADTLSYEDAAAAVTVTLTDDKATVGTAELTLSGIETIKGHSGNDTFKVAGMESGSYTLAGNGGSDTVSFEDAEAGVTASLADTTLTFGSASVTLDGVTTIKGSTKADTFTLGREAVTIAGNGGTDTVVFDYKDAAATPVSAGIVVGYTGDGVRAVSLVKADATYAEAITALNRETADGVGLIGTVADGKVAATAATLTDIAVVNTAQTDVFNIYSSADVSVNGGEGADIYNIDLRGTATEVSVADMSAGNQINLFGIDITSADADAFLGTLTFTWNADAEAGTTTLTLASSDTNFTSKAGVLEFTGKTDSFGGNMLTFWDGAEDLGSGTLLASIDLGSLITNGTSGALLVVGDGAGQAKAVANSPIAEYRINPAA